MYIIGIYLMIMGVLDAQNGVVKNKVIIGFAVICTLYFAIRCCKHMVTFSEGIATVIIVFAVLLFYFVKRDGIGGADVKILIGLAIALNIEDFILLMICAALMALVFIMVNRGFRKKIENVRFIPFIAISYILVSNFLF